MNNVISYLYGQTGGLLSQDKFEDTVTVEKIHVYL